MALRLCTVSLTADRGTTHRVEVHAASLYEAVGLAVEAFRGREWVPPIGPATRLHVVVRQAAVEHEATVAAVAAWTRAAATSPADKLLRTRVRTMLTEPAASPGRSAASVGKSR